MTTCPGVGDLNAPELYVDVIWSQAYESLSERAEWEKAQNFSIKTQKLWSQHF